MADQYGLWQFFDILCCLGVLVPVSWSIKALGNSDSANAHDKGAARPRTPPPPPSSCAPHTHAAAAASLPRLQQFRNFYVTLVVFVYCTRIVALIIKGTLHYSSVRACVRVCVCVCVRARVCVCVWGGGAMWLASCGAHAVNAA